MLTGRLSPAARCRRRGTLGHQLRRRARQQWSRCTSSSPARGYLEARRGSGTIVAEGLPDRWFKGGAPPPLAASARGETDDGPLPLGKGARRLPRSLMLAAETPRPLRPHLPAVEAVPVEAGAGSVAKHARRNDRLPARGRRRAWPPLHAQPSPDHLRVARGVACTADRIVILPSVQQAIDLAARLTLDPGDEVWMEDPGYAGAHAVLVAAGATIVPVPVDAQGIDVAAGGAPRAERAARPASTPGHQAPLGFTLTIERRLALLDWAREQRALVVEDDYDSEYRYEGRPVPALQGSIAPAWCSTPAPSARRCSRRCGSHTRWCREALVDRFVAAKSIVDRFTPPLGQAALADFIEEGHFARHLRRMREIYAERRAALLTAIAADLGDTLTVVGASAGLDVAARLPAGFDDRAVERDLATAGVEAVALSHQAVKRRDVSGLLLGFAAFSPARIRKSIAAAAATIRRTRRRT